MEHTSDTVAEGKLIHETSYPQRAEKYTEIEIGGSKIDFYDARNKVIHEVKKSDSIEDAHEWQVKYYIWLLQQNGIENVTGIVEYPKLKHTSKVLLSKEDATYLESVKKHIEIMVEDDKCPPRINSKICKKCSYYDFCYVEEV
jgi:CRISPR-associated exonuclease Cas4